MSSGSSLARERVFAAFRRDTRGSSAVEFAIVSIPFIFLVLFILQMGIYYMAQASLDAGVIQTADWLVNTYNSGTTPSVNGSSLHTMVYAKSGGMIKNDSTFLVDLRQFGTLTSAPVPIVDGFVDQGSLDSKGVSGSVLALRAQGTITTFMPGFGALATVRSSAIMRRQGS